MWLAEVSRRSQHPQVLVFCTMTRALDVIEEYVEWRGWHYARMDGSAPTEERGTVVDVFNSPGSPTFVFLLSTRTGGVGLNLQAADTVIMYDTDWNPQIDLQAQARVHRLGQQRKVPPTVSAAASPVPGCCKSLQRGRLCAGAGVEAGHSGQRGGEDWAGSRQQAARGRQEHCWWRV